MSIHISSLQPIGDELWYDPITKTIVFYDGEVWQPVFTVSSVASSTVDISSLETQITTLNSAFYNNDPSSQPVKRAVSIGLAPPTNPVANTLWYDTSTNLLKLYDGNNWQALNDVSSLKSQINTLNSAFYNNDPTKTILRATFIGSTAPSNPVAGTIWLDTSQSTPILKIYDGNNWQTASSSSSSSSSSSNRVDLSNATSDYNLDVNQEAIINFSNVSSVPLHISTTNGTYYQMDIVLSNTSGTSGGGSNPVYLNPNNTTYSNAFVYQEIFRDGNGQSSSSATYNSFRIGWAISTIRCYVANYTVNKHIKGIYYDTGVSSSPAIDINTCYWKDTSTAWTSLGTITFPQSSSGFVLVKRLV